MARPINRQSRSVGNLGDILKHAALFQLASALAKKGPVRYVDTHTYLLHAPLADAERWHREVDDLLATRPAYAGYAAHECASLTRTARYRCSSGLVVDVLGDRRAAAILGEANGATRAELREQIVEEGHASVVVVDEAATALRDASIVSGGTVLVHVDPFALTPLLWASLAPGLDGVCARAADAAIVVYRYTRSGPSPWPAAPSGTRLVAETRGGPHEVAVYASRGFTDAARDVCEALGWRLVASSS